MQLKKVNDEVYVAAERVVKLDRTDIEFLKQQIVLNPRKRIRICAHPNSDDRLHEMMIVLGRETYIRPHKHSGKSESFLIIEGQVDILVFDDEGRVTEVVELGDYGSGRKFFYRLPPGLFHTLHIRSELIIFHETTNGPFNRADTLFAPWSPAEEDVLAGLAFISRLAR